MPIAIEPGAAIVRPLSANTMQKSVHGPSVSGAAVLLLIIEQEAGSLDSLSEALAQPGVEIIAAFGAQAGMEAVWLRRPHIVLVGPGLPADMLPRIAEVDPAIRMLRLPESSPAYPLELRQLFAEAVQNARSEQTLHPGEPMALPAFEGIIGRSPPMREVFTHIRRIAPFYTAALITGETGTGKDLVARALHRLSPVSTGRFVVLNCSAVVETLFESEIFGHVKGSFTGATTDKPRFFEHADGGTLFLDEIGDMPLATQAKLLRVLQNQEVQRVGSLTMHKVNVRVIAATNHDLQALIQKKLFRPDLYYRLSMVEIRMPRLLDRREDLPLLTQHFIARFAAEYGKRIHGLSHSARVRLAAHSWHGNVRELENVIGHAAMMTAGGTIEVSDFPPYLQISAEPVSDFESTGTQGESLFEQERLVLLRALEVAGGNQSKAARLLRIGRDALRYKLRKHNLDAAAQGNQALRGLLR